MRHQIRRSEVKHRARRAAWLALPLIALLAPGVGAHRGGADYSMEVLVDGRPLTEYAARGTTYVEALRGREYSVRLTNRSGERVGFALSVDGLNTIDAATTGAREARKWIVGPHESVVIHGWQTGGTTARRFFFTSEERSYGAWLGRTENLGVIAAAVFRERGREPVPVPIDGRYLEETAGPRGGDSRRKSGPAPEAPEAAERMESTAARPTNAPPAEDEFAATGIGREMEHRVREVTFEPEASPAARIEVRYEYRDSLVRLGVLPRRSGDDPLARRERARGFDDSGFAPDPYR